MISDRKNIRGVSTACPVGCYGWPQQNRFIQSEDSQERVTPSAMSVANGVEGSSCGSERFSTWGTADSYPQVEAGICCNKRYTFCYRGRKITHIGSDLRFCVFLMVAQRCLAPTRVSTPKALVECRLYGGRRPTCPRVTKGIPFVTADSRLYLRI